MSNLDMVISQIRFNIEQIKPRNSHHEFEHLCRHLAKVKVCENIIPATGPVAGSGDQGRDFETYRTHIKDGIFLGNTTDKDISFGCTLQENGVKRKILGDVEKIMDSPMNTDEIHFFYGVDIKVADRHELQKQVDEKYGIRLEVYDAQAISEMLADIKVFWIAEKYLNIPREIFPVETEEKNDWYRKIKENSISIDNNVNYADYTDIKLAARHVLLEDEVKLDIDFWFVKLKEIVDKTVHDDIADKALYELIVYAIKTNRTDEIEDNLYSYLDDIYENGDNFQYQQLEGRSIIIKFTMGLFKRGIVIKDEKKIIDWKDQLNKLINNRLTTTTSINDKVMLLELKGFLSIKLNSRQAFKESIKQAIEIWIELIHLIDDAPLFPLERFLDRINEYAFMSENYDEFSDLMDKTEEAFAKRQGNISLAEKAKRRAMKLYEDNNYTEAIKQLHKVKINWYQEETLKGNILTLLMLSKCYLQINLPYAAKYNALLASEVAHSSNDESLLKYISSGLEQASHCDYIVGSWYSYLDLMEVGLMGNFLFESNPYDDEKLQSWIYNSSMILTLSTKFDSAIFQTTSHNIFKSSLKEDVEEIYPLMNKEYSNKTLDSIWNRLEEQLLWKPFSDTTKQRSYAFIALGITWNIQWENTYKITPKVEQFLSLLQTIIADIAREDFMFLSTMVSIKLTLSPNNKLEINNEPSNENRYWEILLPKDIFEKKDEMVNYQTDFFVTIHQIFRDVSLLEEQKFKELIEKELKNKILAKVIFYFSYEIIYRNFRTEEAFNSYTIFSQTENVTQREFKLKRNDKLPWIATDANYLSKQERLATIKRRYTNSKQPIKLTLKRLLYNQNLVREIKDLKQQKNYKDWHILMAIAAIATNYRVNELIKNKEIGHHQEFIQEVMNKEESDKDIFVPDNLFTIERINESIMFNALPSLKMMGYSCFQETPDLLAIVHFMRERLNYFEEDIEHEEIF